MSAHKNIFIDYYIRKHSKSTQQIKFIQTIEREATTIKSMFSYRPSPEMDTQLFQPWQTTPKIALPIRTHQSSNGAGALPSLWQTQHRTFNMLI